MTLRVSDDDPSLNPGETDYQNKFNVLKNAEKNGSFDSNINGSKDIDIDDVKNAEDNPNSGWENNVSGKTNNGRRAGGRFSFIKEKGPLTAIILTILGGGIGISGLLSPSLLIINLKEVMVSKFNTQLTSLDIRTNKILKNKTLGNAGICSSVVSIACKYSSMSNKQIANFKNAGIDVEVEGSTILGRNKPKSFTFEGKSITPEKFSSELSTNAKFRTAVKKGYNPLFAGFADSIGSKVLFTVGGKSGVKLDGGTPEEKLGDIQDKTKNPSKSTIGEPPNSNNYPGGKENTNYIKDLENYNKAKAIALEVADGAADVVADAAKNSIKATTKTTVNSLKAGLVSLANGLKATGPIDNACTVYGLTRSVGFAAKTVRALQLATYAMIFLKIADQIKAGGNPNPDDVSYLGSVLTAEVSSVDLDSSGNAIKNADGTDKISKKSATDSFGYKYAAYGETGIMPDSTSQFLAGGGLTGSLIFVTSMINSVLGKTPNTTCKIINNVFIQIGSMAIGIGAAVASGGFSLTVEGAFQVLTGVGTAIAIMYLPVLLQDIVAGVAVDESTVGELAGDAITSGASNVMGDVAASGGNAPLTVPQAVAYQNLSNKIASQYAEEDRLAYGPFDISNKNTFLGSVFAKVIPYITASSSLTGTLSSAFSMVTTSFSSIIPSTKAASETEYSYCKDLDYVNLGVATDPYCNVVYGIPAENLEIDPLVVLSEISKEIDDNGNAKPGSKYESFINDCTNRGTPLGYTGDSFDKSDGSECIIGSKKAQEKYPNIKYYYLFQIDQRIEKGMDGEDETLNLAMESGLKSDIGFYDGSNGVNNIAKTSNATSEAIINNTFTGLSSWQNSTWLNFTNAKNYSL